MPSRAGEPASDRVRTGSLACLLPALAAVGAGLVELAIGSGGPLLPGAVFVVVGAAHLTWAVSLLATDRVRLPLVMVGIAVLMMLSWPVLLAVSSFVPDLSPMLRPLPIGTVALLNLAVAMLIIAGRRMPRHLGAPGQTVWFVWLLSATALVSLLVTPALAAAPPGDSARPHGEPAPLIEPPHRHQ